MNQKPLIHDPEDKITGWGIVCLLGICLVIIATGLLVASLPGCAALDKVAHATTQAAGDPIVNAAADTFPYGKLGLVLAGMIGGGYLLIRRRLAKSDAPPTTGG